MVSKAQVESFTQSWDKTVNWAKQNNIPYSSYYPVYQLDTQRMVSGSQMSESERIRAIEAAHGLNYSTALPTDNPGDVLSPQGEAGNAVKNAQDIFTGLEPTHLIPNLWDTVKNTVEHPSSLWNVLGDTAKSLDPFSNHTQTDNALKALVGQVSKPDSPLLFIPGVADIAKFEQASYTGGLAGGAKALAADPISSLLDVVPFGRVLSEGLGRTPLAEGVADKIGITEDELRKAGIWRVGGKYIKSLTPPSILTRVDNPLLQYTTDPETGVRTATGVKAQPTIGERWEFFKQKIGASGEQADIVEARLKQNDEGTRAVEEYTKPALDALGELKPEERDALTRWAQSDFRTLDEKMADEKVPLNIRNAYEAVWQWQQQHEQIQMQAGSIAAVRTPWLDDNGQPITELYHVNTDQYRAVSRALDQSTKDQKTLDEAAKPFDMMLYKMDENDRNMQGVFKVLEQQRKTVYESIKRSIPQEPDTTVTSRLRSALPAGQRWDRAVSMQTPLIRNLLGLLPSDRLTLHQVNTLRDLFADGGLLDQENEAFSTQDWVQLNKVAKAAVRKFESKSMESIPKDGRATLNQIRNITKNLQKYASERQRMAEELNKLATGYYRGGRASKAVYSKSIAALSEKAAKSHQNFLKVAVHNPPDIWRNVNMDTVTTKLSQADKTAAAMEDTSKTLSSQGWADSELTKIRQDPRTMLELMTNSAKSSLENNMLPDIDHEESIRVQEDSYQELASLRARGQAPLYVHMLTTHDIDEGLSPDYNVFIRGIKARKPSASFSRTWGYTPTVYDIGAGMLKATKDMVEQDMMQKFVSQELVPRLYDAGDVVNIVTHYYRTEIAALADQAARGLPRTETESALLERGIKKMGLVSYDPKDIFGEGFSHPTLPKAGSYYIRASDARTFSNTINKFQFPAQNIIDRGTNLFRFSILGLSPRYTAHILFGGSFLVALRANPGMLRFLPNAVHFALHNSFDDKIIKRFPGANELIGTHSTQEGAAMAQYHYATMNSAGRNWLIPEWLSRHGLPDEYKSRVRAAADINIRFTRAITRAQKAVVYLDGATRAEKSGSFYADQLVPRTDAEGNNVIHPVTGKQMYDTVRSKVPMTASEAHKEGMDAVAEVMGNLRHMTPLERSLLTRVFPFYGWTKHILQYVMSYPFDHPYRAMVLSNLAMQDSEDTASGLPLRIQLLTFIGQPDENGNVTALDTKALDPLRDTANYASLTGLFESLNPAVTGFVGLVDPQISFGGQNLYPNVSFSDLYGTKTAGPGGNIYTAAEQFVPQLSSLDEAFNLSGQYGYLAQDPQAFSKKIFESLGLPFTPQQLNLRQMAAQEEIDRYGIAQTAAYDYATGSNPNALAGYAANDQLPDPLNTEYNVTPAYLEAMQSESEKEFNLPYYETATPPPSPAL